jgi:nucleoside-diphosphate-sugar epimerase
VHNLIHGFILAAEHLVPGGTAPGQAYFINDGEPVNMFEFSRPVVEACGFTTEQAMRECLPYHTELFKRIKAEATPQPAPA